MAEKELDEVPTAEFSCGVSLRIRVLLDSKVAMRTARRASGVLRCRDQ